MSDATVNLTDLELDAATEALDGLADITFDAAADLDAVDKLDALVSVARKVGAVTVAEHWAAKAEYLRGELEADA